MTLQGINPHDNLRAQELAGATGLANLFSVQGSFQEARTRAESVLKEDPSQISAQLLLPVVTRNWENLQAALQEAQQAVQMAPDKPAP